MYCGELELTLPPANSQLDHLPQAPGKICKFKDGSPWCRSGAEVSLCWLIPAKATGMSPPEPQTIPEYNRQYLETLHERDAWEMGNKPYREGKNKVRVQEKLSSSLTHTQLSFSLSTPNILSGLTFLKIFSESHPVRTV